MSTGKQTTRKQAGATGLAGALRNSFQTGLNVAEKMHQAAVEVPLNMLPAAGVSEEQATALKDKHRNLLRGMYGAIDSVGSKAIDFGGEQARNLKAELLERAEQQQAKDSKVDRMDDKVVAEVDKDAA